MSLCGEFPSTLKEAVIRPGLKKPNLDSDDFKSYRPISNLTFISKIIEKCAHKQLVKYIEDNSLFADLQSGYRKAHSCETTITRIHNDLLYIMDSGNNALLLLLDLSAAFDTVNHQLLINKLQIKMFRSQFEKRTEIFFYNVLYLLNPKGILVC